MAGLDTSAMMMTLAVVFSAVLSVAPLRSADAEADASDPTPVPSPAASPTPEPPPEPSEPESEGAGERPPRPFLAGGFAMLFPGLGHVYLGEPERGAVFLGAELTELGAAVATVNLSGWDPDDPSDTRFRRALLPLAWLQNTHLLGVYDAWRLARLRAPPGRYRTATPTPDSSTLLLAPLRFGQLKRPGVVFPLAAVWAAGGAAAYATYRSGEGEATFFELMRIPVFSREVDRSVALGAAFGYYGATFYSVGIGEEAFFRGVLQTAFEEQLGPTWGWIAMSVFFGSLHVFNGETLEESATAVSATTLVGAWLGWLFQKTGYDLTAPVFAHTWYNIGIGMTTFLLDPENQPFTASVAIPF